MNTNIATTREQSDRLLQCGVPAGSADMMITPHNTLSTNPYKSVFRDRGHSPAWSLSALLGFLPFKIHSVRYEYWLDIAPMDYGKQWSIGYYCTEKPRVIKGLTHTDSLIECAVQEIEWLTANGYKLNGIEKGGSEHGED